MTTITQFNGLSTDELLRHVDEARSKSPIIEELCQRLEAGAYPTIVPVTIETACPVCLVELEITYDGESDKSEVEASL